MTPTEIIFVVTSTFAVVVPAFTSYVAYRKTMSDIALQKAAQNDADEMKRMEFQAGQPERDANANNLFFATMKNLVETLRAEIKNQADTYEANRLRYVQEIQALRTEIAQLDIQLGDERAAHRKEVMALRNENADLKILANDLNVGIEKLTEQVERRNERVAYKKLTDTGPLLGYEKPTDPPTETQPGDMPNLSTE